MFFFLFFFWISGVCKVIYRSRITYTTGIVMVCGVHKQYPGKHQGDFLDDSDIWAGLVIGR